MHKQKIGFMIETARKKIDEIDTKLLKLLAERLEIVQEIGEYKKKNHLPIQNQERERKMIKDRIQKLKEFGFDDEELVQELFELIMKKSREMQEQR